MTNDDLNILPGDDNDINDQKLMDYLNDKLPVDEKVEMDKLIETPGLLNDALEGLQQFQNTNNLPAFVNQLNAGLHKQLQKKRQRRLKHTVRYEQWIYISIIIILALAIIGFIVIRERLGK